MSEVSLPSDAAIRKKLDKLVRKVDVTTMKFKAFMKLLEHKMKVPSLRAKKQFIRQTITDILDSMEDDNKDSEDEGSNRDNEESDEEPKKKKKKKKKSGEMSEAVKANPFNTPKELSPALASFLGQGTHMSRPQVIKAMWEHIREKNLQNPDNKREILLDHSMQEVFGVERFTMFKMAKYLSAHIYPFKPLNLDDDADDSSTKKRKKENKSKAKKKQKTPAKKKFPIYKLSDTLAEVVGKDILTRQKVTQLLTAYIKERELQNPEDRRQIICDKRLKRVMDGNSMVTFFTMQKYISPHLLEKVGIENDDEGDTVQKQVDDSSRNSEF